MEEQLVSFETAKLAKEKGFPQRNDDNDEHSGFACGKCWVMDIDGAKNVWGNSNAMAAWACPTQSLLQKWLRDKHDIHVNPIPNFLTKAGKYHCGIVFLDEEEEVDTIIIKEKNKVPYDVNKLFNTYEQALEKGLYEALKLI